MLCKRYPFGNSYGPFYRLLYLEVGRKLKNLLWNSAKLMNTLKFLQNIIMSFITIYMTNQQSLTSLGNKLVIAGALVHSGWAINNTNECCKLRFFFFCLSPWWYSFAQKVLVEFFLKFAFHTSYVSIRYMVLWLTRTSRKKIDSAKD